jgi:Resolvase, N terminal domain
MVYLLRSAIYSRVSTDDQSCERQERDLRAFAKRAGHKVIAVFKETASGVDDNRPERAKVMALPGPTKSTPSLSAAAGAAARRISSGRSMICTAGR